MTNVTPPRWLETILHVSLASRDRQTVSGDLLEKYRSVVRPARGKARADLWYALEVAGFAWRSNVPWGVLLGLAFLIRTAIDWFVPTHDFHDRSLASTVVSGAILLCAAFWAARRSQSIAAGVFTGAATALFAAVISIAGVSSLFAIWHDPQTMAAIQGSGGLEEALTLPLMLVVPGIVLGAVGGLFGSLTVRFSRA